MDGVEAAQNLQGNVLITGLREKWGRIYFTENKSVPGPSPRSQRIIIAPVWTPAVPWEEGYLTCSALIGASLLFRSFQFVTMS